MSAAPVKTHTITAVPFTQSEDEFAQIFADKYHEQYKHDHTSGSWYQFNGAIWQRDNVMAAYNEVRLLMRRIGEGKQKNATSKMIKAVLDISKTDPRMALTRDRFDQDDLKLGTPDGTVNLATGKVLSANPQDFITRSAAVVPVFDKPALWLEFLSEATGGDQEVINFLQEWCGYLLTGLTQEQVFLFIFGGGGNGKSVFVNTIMGIMGDYAQQAPMETFTASKAAQHSTDLAMLQGARCVTATETEEGRAWAEAKIKQMTGADPITARFMRKDNFTYIPKFKITIVGNYAPVLQSVDQAMRRRIRILPFDKKPGRPDPLLERRLREEWPQILGWMVEGVMRWRKNGLSSPERMMASTDEYFSGQDVMGQFLEDYCFTEDNPPPNSDGTNLWATKKELFMAWQIFCRNNGEDAGMQRGFSFKMTRRGFRERRAPDASRQRCWTGVQLRRSINEF